MGRAASNEADPGTAVAGGPRRVIPSIAPAPGGWSRRGCSGSRAWDIPRPEPFDRRDDELKRGDRALRCLQGLISPKLLEEGARIAPAAVHRERREMSDLGRQGGCRRRRGSGRRWTSDCPQRSGAIGAGVARNRRRVRTVKGGHRGRSRRRRMSRRRWRQDAIRPETSTSGESPIRGIGLGRDSWREVRSY